MKTIICETCHKEMKFLGNISGLVYTSYPEQWDDVYACDDCKTKQTVREHGYMTPNYNHITEYKEQN
jgi:hypothetical protein